MILCVTVKFQVTGAWDKICYRYDLFTELDKNIKLLSVTTLLCQLSRAHNIDLQE